MKLEQIIENYYDATEKDDVLLPESVGQARIIFQHNQPEYIIKILRNLMDMCIDDSLGICFNLDQNMNESGVFSGGYALVEWLSVEWEHHTGVGCYPVPYDDTCSLWEGQNLEYRISLIDYIINQLEQLEL